MVNGGGALATGIALAVILVAKFTEGAWITLLVIPATLGLLRLTRHYYDDVDREVLTGSRRRLALRGPCVPRRADPNSTLGPGGAEGGRLRSSPLRRCDRAASDGTGGSRSRGTRGGAAAGLAAFRPAASARSRTSATAADRRIVALSQRAGSAASGGSGGPRATPRPTDRRRAAAAGRGTLVGNAAPYPPRAPASRRAASSRRTGCGGRHRPLAAERRPSRSRSSPRKNPPRCDPPLAAANSASAPGANPSGNHSSANGRAPSASRMVPVAAGAAARSRRRRHWRPAVRSRRRSRRRIARRRTVHGWARVSANGAATTERVASLRNCRRCIPCSSGARGRSCRSPLETATPSRASVQAEDRLGTSLPRPPGSGPLLRWRAHGQVHGFVRVQCGRDRAVMLTVVIDGVHVQITIRVVGAAIGVVQE